MWIDDAPRIGGPASFGQALGAKDDGPLVLGSAKAATCPHCGRPGKEIASKTLKGRDVIVHVPQEHVCRGPRK